MKTELKTQNNIDREEWDSFIRHSPQGMIYALSDYMDLVAPDWRGIELRKDGKIVALMPIQSRKKWGLEYSLQPPFTQYWGIFFAPTQWASPYKEFSFKRKAIKAILEAIPKSFRWISYNFAPSFNYGLPFHWEGYELKARYTYQLDLETEPDKLWAALGPATRQDIRKTQGGAYTIEAESDPAALMELIRLNLEAGRPLVPEAQQSTLEQVARYLLDSQQGFLLCARSEAGVPLTAGLFAQFGQTCVYLSSARRPGADTGPLMSNLLWEAILKAREDNALFDFEGSMMEGIEAFFRGYSGSPQIYLHIQKNNLPLLVKWITRSR